MLPFTGRITGMAPFLCFICKSCGRTCSGWHMLPCVCVSCQGLAAHTDWCALAIEAGWRPLETWPALLQVSWCRTRCIEGINLADVASSFGESASDLV